MTKLKFKTAALELEYEGDQKFLESKVVHLIGELEKSQNEVEKRNLLGIHQELQELLTRMNKHVANMEGLGEAMNHLGKNSFDQVADSIGKLSASPTDPAVIDETLKQLQETQMSFTVEYLRLQQHMQNENREYTMIANIMKTKQDTVKNSISNIR